MLARAAPDVEDQAQVHGEPAEDETVQGIDPGPVRLWCALPALLYAAEEPCFEQHVAQNKGGPGPVRDRRARRGRYVVRDHLVREADLVVREVRRQNISYGDADGAGE